MICFNELEKKTQLKGGLGPQSLLWENACKLRDLCYIMFRDVQKPTKKFLVLRLACSIKEMCVTSTRAGNGDK